MKKLITLFFFFFICTNSVMAKVELCNFSFLANSQEEPSTLFISYLDFLNERKALEVDEFEEILVRLESGELINPFEAKEVSKENESYGRVFQDYINVGIDEEKVKAYLETIVQREKQTAREIDKTKEIMKNIFKPIEFGVIIPGSSKGDFGIDYSFEAMTTPVTNAHWNAVFEKPLLAEESELFDKPKTNVNFFAQSVFADLLSKSRGYDPVFNIDFKKTGNSLNAYDGNIEIKDQYWKSKNPIIEKLGYRLPTKNEQDLLLQQAQDFIGKKGFEEKIDDYAYLFYNSKRQTQPVAAKEAYYINNRDFYDIIGNVLEAHLAESSNHSRFLYLMNSGTGSYLSNFNNFDHMMHEGSLRARRSSLGFRLVRTLKK